MKRLFDLGIAYDEESGAYIAIVNSLTDNKTLRIGDQNLRVVLSKVSRMIRKKAKEIKCFPLEKPESDRLTASDILKITALLQPNGTGAMQKLMPPIRN